MEQCCSRKQNDELDSNFHILTACSRARLLIEKGIIMEEEYEIEIKQKVKVK
jgi:hypothetical protein